jgi:coenzyme Q-binding protein COQ10
METIRLRRRVRHSAGKMLELVADIERYPEFVPLCESHRIISRSKRGLSEILITEMTIDYGILKEIIRVRDTIDRENGRIMLDGLGGPLRRLQGSWTFASRKDGTCDVALDLTYEFANPLLGLILSRVLRAALNRFLAAFEQHADLVYACPPRRYPVREQALRP